jgi:hypothetical protein
MATETKQTSKPGIRPLPPQLNLEEYLKSKPGGPKKTSNMEHLLGAGEDLWADDAELDAFLKMIDEAGKPGD